MARKTIAGQRIWITGASSGIGRATAVELARRGARLALTARNETALHALAWEINAKGTLVLPGDVSDRETNLAIAQTIQGEWGGLDIALLNAGICEYPDVRTWDSALFERALQTNVMSVVYGTEAMLPLLRKSARPHLLGMSSTVTIGGLPRAEAYGASKAAIRYLLESLRVDLWREKIVVTVIMPGFVRTPLTDKNDFPMPMMIEAETAARSIADGIERERLTITFPWLFAALFRMLRLLPEGWYARLAARGARA